MKSAEIRQQFIDYFCNLGHRYVPSAPLVPADDPTLLFTNAGMNQFKDVFLGAGARDYVRAVNSQKCMRVSGKHNDLEDVGKDTYHHTFFEMLGNWSFGDYYKREAIEWAWKLFTNEWKISPERLRATVFTGDDESARIWPEVSGMRPEQVLRFGEDENFWEMAETGPCGPCSEIHVDMGEKHCRRRGEPGHRCVVNGDCGRYVEIWNLVFIQYNKDEQGKLQPLPKKHVDTGMGFERLAAVLQGVDSNYATDLFVPILAALEEATGERFVPDSPRATPFRAIADHLRGLSFTIADGALPSNDGRGYVLRMLLRRAVRYGCILGIEEPFLYKLVPVVASIMGDAYPELIQHREHVSRVILSEEERFHNTLSFGLELLAEIIKNAKTRGQKIISGKDVFKLYDTYGFPVDLTGLIAREEGLSIDEKTFKELMEDQKERARVTWKAAPAGRIATVYKEIMERNGGTGFCGYEMLSLEATITALLREGKEVDMLAEGQEGELVLDRTPFYAEAGGQVGDEGRICSDTATALVSNTRSPLPGLVVHRVKMINGGVRAGERVKAEVNEGKRLETARNHTATHLLQNALKQVLGEHIKQSGSLVAPGRLRFDFTHFTAMSPREIERVEEIVNERVRENTRVEVYEMPFEEVRTKDIIAIFGEKYGDRVRVIDIGNYSKELCGGTHVNAVGQIGLFTILGEASVAAGVRRIEALSGEGAFHLSRKREHQIAELAEMLKVESDKVVERVEALSKECKSLKKTAGREHEKEAIGDVSELIREAMDVGGIPVVTAELKGLQVDGLRNAGDRIRQKLPSGVILLGARHENKAHIICMVSEDLVKKGLHAGAIVKDIGKVIGGSGGGRPQIAQAGGPQVDKLAEALEKTRHVIEKMMKQ
jgi:alanyl-tRNA synthetase